MSLINGFQRSGIVFLWSSKKFNNELLKITGFTVGFYPKTIRVLCGGVCLVGVSLVNVEKTSSIFTLKYDNVVKNDKEYPRKL